MNLVDTHCHIHEAAKPAGELYARFPSADPDVMISTATAEGVNKMICVGTTLRDSHRAVEFAGQHSNVWASIGLHPHEAKDYCEGSTLKQVERDDFTLLAKEAKVVAVGECGLDYYYNHSPKNQQITILKFQIELAISRGLPLIFHVREAFNDFWPILDLYPSVRGVIHSFTDSQDNLNEALRRGLFIGVNGIATFAKEPERLDVYKSIPLSSLLLETDSPFLTPTPYRGRMNEPKFVRQVAEYLSNIRGEDLSLLAVTTTNNAQKLFRLE
jgi:TatD DNase family protein